MNQLEPVAFKVVDIGEPETKNRIEFRFDEFNDRRYARGAKAARVYIDQFDGQGETWLWMDADDLKANIASFGDHPELKKALKHYR